MIDLTGRHSISIIDLPPELFSSILRYANASSPHDGYLTLASCALVCRVFRATSQELLFSNAVLPDLSSWKLWSDEANAELRKSTRSIWANAIGATAEDQRALDVVLAETDNLKSLSIHLRPDQLGVFGLPALQDLTSLSLFIKAPRSIDPRLPCPSPITVPFSLTSLTLSGDFHAALPSPLLSSLVPASIETLTCLDLSTWRESHRPELWALLRPLAPSLLRFALPNFETAGSASFLAACSRLRHLSCFEYNYRDPLPPLLETWRVRNDLSCFAAAAAVDALEKTLQRLDLPYENEEHAVRVENGMKNLLKECKERKVEVRFAEGRREDGIEGEWERWA